MRITLILFLYLLQGNWGFGQQIRDIRAEVKDIEGRQVEISYVLEDLTNKEVTYKVDLYIINNGKRDRLYSVSGGVGDSIYAGAHKILWKADQEFSRYQGYISFEVRAVKNFMILEPSLNVIMRRGKNYTFEWFGEGSISDTLMLELYQFNTRVDSIARVIGSNQYTWEIPRRTPPGEDYQLRIYGKNNPSIDAKSKKFIIKRQLPLALQIGAGVLAAGIVTAIIFLPDDTPGNNKLPPPEPLDSFRN